MTGLSATTKKVKIFLKGRLSNSNVSFYELFFKNATHYRRCLINNLFFLEWYGGREGKPIIFLLPSSEVRYPPPVHIRFHVLVVG